VCKEFSADIFIHGSTGAGNDQYRFDVAAQVLGQGTIICRAPIREFSITRSFAAQYLQEGGIRISEKETNYSYNPGLWGVSIGGKETLRSDGLLPDDAWYSKPVSTINEMELILSFKKGTLDKLSYRGECISSPVAIIKRINVRN
jgi:argininosuccinate synthase